MTAELFSDVWDITFRWAPARTDDQEAIIPAETLLITGHAPPFNNQHVRKYFPAEHSDLMVLNAGKKGRLLPVLVGAYYCNECWPDAR